MFRAGIVHFTGDDRGCNSTEGFDDRNRPLSLSKQGKKSLCGRKVGRKPLLKLPRMGLRVPRSNEE